MRNFKFAVLFLALMLTVSGLSSAQTKKRSTKKTTRTTVKTTATPPKTATTAPLDETPVKTEVKKNERPTEANSGGEPQKKNATTDGRTTTRTAENPVYFYEFAQPTFAVTKIFIEHDETGKGKITFIKRDYDEAITDPVQLSPATLEKIKNAFAELGFLESKEEYQDAKRNYAHLGEIKLKMKKDGRERTTGFNWTENETAKLLMNEYRRIGTQYVWMFDVNLARQNQPLNSPALLDALDSYIRRNEISDPPQMIPFLQKLSNDERIPLIARNHAARLIKDIEKKAAKEKD